MTKKLTLKLLEKTFKKMTKGMVQVTPNMWVSPEMIEKEKND